MNLDARRIAADARRIAGAEGEGRAAEVEKVREIVRKNYERGVAAGRKRERRERQAVHPRLVLLDLGITMLREMAGQVDQIPNSERVRHAFQEAEAILRDASETDHA